MVLFSAQQFRSQVHRRVVGNSATSLYGRMDMDELATPGYAVLSAATRTKLATLEKGQLMVRHPHFAQPIFVRFPRPASMRGRDGAERFPPSTDVAIDVAVMRDLRTLDPAISLDWIKRTIAGHDEAVILRARNVTMQQRPERVQAFFEAQFRRIVAPEAPARPSAVPIRSLPSDDPYGF